jgi:hypothetical protein
MLIRPEAKLSSAAQRVPALVDEFLESYVFWRESCEVVRATYEWWTTCEPAQRALAFDSHCVALDREDLAAEAYADRTARLRAGRP